MRRGSVIGHISHVWWGRSTMHEHRDLILRLLRIVTTLIWGLRAGTVSVVVIGIWVSFRGTLAMHWGRGIVVHCSISGPMTRIVVPALVLEKRLCSLLGRGVP